MTEPKHPQCRTCRVWQARKGEADFSCPGLPEHKSELRRAITVSLSSMTPEIRRQKSEAICRHVKGIDLYARARTVMAYVALEMEPDPWSLIREMWQAGKRVVVPRVEPPFEEPRIGYLHQRKVIPVLLKPQYVDDPHDHGELEMTVFGICEPKSAAAAVPPDEIDLILVPCLAFDRHGNRMGKGGGFYDRFLSQNGVSAATCGLAFSEQVFGHLPVCPHDHPVDLLVTETGVHDFRCSKE
ncbi:MAG: 5-formyltetrahydrofolate cyclo-ligase [Planctomycetes bacterium]|nr:5-formyltetrahydrofolate cyclo-ligase [Planctomycetota bacterium]